LKKADKSFIVGGTTKRNLFGVALQSAQKMFRKFRPQAMV